MIEAGSLGSPESDVTGVATSETSEDPPNEQDEPGVPAGADSAPATANGVERLAPDVEPPGSSDRRGVVEPARNALRRIRSGVTTASEANEPQVATLDDAARPDPHTNQSESPDRRRVVEPARNALRRIRSGVTTASEATVDLVGHAVVGVERSWSERPGARVRRVRRLGSVTLPFLYDVYPEARAARPVDVGLETIDTTDIAGTAVGGGAQRGGDFLPLKAFRGANWHARWQRLREANDKLVMLPPVDVLRYGNAYWVVDGHNRVALALYTGQVGIDANVVELVRPGARRQEPILPLAPTVLASQAVRTAGGGKSPSLVLGHEDDASIELPAVADDANGGAAGAIDTRGAPIESDVPEVADAGGEQGTVEPRDATDRSDSIE